MIDHHTQKHREIQNAHESRRFRDIISHICCSYGSCSPPPLARHIACALGRKRRLSSWPETGGACAQLFAFVCRPLTPSVSPAFKPHVEANRTRGSTFAAGRLARDSTCALTSPPIA